MDRTDTETEAAATDSHTDVDRLATAVAELQTELNRADRATAQELGVGAAEDLQVLRLLLTEGPLRVGELARKRASSMTTSSGRIARLEKKGLVQRDRMPGDLRAMVVTLTTAGDKVARQSRDSRLKILAPLASDFRIDALRELTAALQGAVARKEHTS